MDKQTSGWLSKAVPTPSHKANIRLQLIQIADGDVAFEAKMREMIWHAYCEADRPCGPSEEDMFTWLEQQQAFGES